MNHSDAACRDVDISRGDGVAATRTFRPAPRLRYMHRFGVVHRDLKFENVLFQSKAPESEVMVIDFGLAKAGGPSGR